MSQKTALYVIENQENLHVGSGNANFGVVDLEVQRDPLTGWPLIHSSSLKGAFREYWSECIGDRGLEDVIFGPDSTANSKATGALKFFPGYLLSLPARSSHFPYQETFCPAMVKDLMRRVDLLNLSSGLSANLKARLTQTTSLNPGSKALVADLVSSTPGQFLEDWVTQASPIFDDAEFRALIGDHPACLADREFAQLASRLPVIPHNCLEDGVSKNLWFKEVVPRYSRFTFALLWDSRHDHAAIEFEKHFHGSVVQIGAGNSIGEGYCSVRKILASAPAVQGATR